MAEPADPRWVWPPLTKPGLLIFFNFQQIQIQMQIQTHIGLTSFDQPWLAPRIPLFTNTKIGAALNTSENSIIISYVYRANSCIFYRTRVRSLFTLVSNWLTNCRLVNLIDVALACEDNYSKLVEIVIVADVDDEDRVGNSLLQIWKLRFGHKT